MIWGCGVKKAPKPPLDKNIPSVLEPYKKIIQDQWDEEEEEKKKHRNQAS
jgi:hypothetical protein